MQLCSFTRQVAPGTADLAVSAHPPPVLLVAVDAGEGSGYPLGSDSCSNDQTYCDANFPRNVIGLCLVNRVSDFCGCRF